MMETFYSVGLDVLWIIPTNMSLLRQNHLMLWYKLLTGISLQSMHGKPWQNDFFAHTCNILHLGQSKIDGVGAIFYTFCKFVYVA